MKKWISLLRISHWIKNLLVFVPIIASHSFSNLRDVQSAIILFFLFGICASGVYIINDVMDIQSDRQHHAKKNRPIAKGVIKVRSAVFLAMSLMVSTLIIAQVFLPSALGILTLYMFSTFIYTLRLKKILFLDVIFLVFFYEIRIIAGGLATDIKLSIWLLGFTSFFFLSLALAKRYSELGNSLIENQKVNFRRGYLPEDAMALSQLGISASYSSIIILILYLANTDTSANYNHPEWLFGLVPLFTYWMSTFWLTTIRTLNSEDAVQLIFRDRRTLIVLPLILVIFLASM